ncbi:serine hydrolase [Frankia sp. R82]|uniref:serine hydrolase n=1 Tax=Frankia sp. R82 TaxID=2950553 RepID=UPI0020432439|nr:serine hydrolase [Frankia sp. R82]MCM3883465.1 class A beta-lactamase-related serine hydrolase [Frankia sp. R82]
MAAGLCGGLQPHATDEVTSSRTVEAKRASAVAPAAPTAGVPLSLLRSAEQSSGRVLGAAVGVTPVLTVNLSASTGAALTIVPVVATSPVASAVAGTATPPPAAPVPAGLEAQVRAYLAGRPGHVSVAVYDAVAGTTVAVTDPTVVGYEMASTVKLDILTALVRSAGPAGTLTARQRILARKMISVSDNDAALALWQDAGAGAGMSTFFAQLGMAATSVDPNGHWGLTRTTAADQLAVLRAISYPGILTAAQRVVITSLLQTVIPAQRWGLTGGVPSGVAVELKNGWLPRTDGWVITSLAHVHGAGRDYVMAVYSKDGPSMRSGIDTVQGLSALAWNATAASPPLAG